MAVVFAFEKFKSYLILSKTIVHTNHSALRNLFKKQDAKPRLIRWILLMQEFDIEIKDTKGTKNVAADHLSRIKNDESSDDNEVDNNFPRETLMEINTKDEPWFADFANYLVGDVIPKGMTYQQKNNFFFKLKHYFWEEPYLFKVCSDGMIISCISRPETRTILDQCHHGLTGGHYGPNVTTKKVIDLGFYWSTIIKEAYTLVRLCESCQKIVNISKRDEIPLNNIQLCQIFDIWGIDFMGPFLKSYNFNYILVTIDYVSKWAEAQALRTNDARVVVTFLKRLFCHFGMPKALISDRGPYVVKHQYPSGYVELYGNDGKTFKVNGHRLKLYHEEDNDLREAINTLGSGEDRLQLKELMELCTKLSDRVLNLEKTKTAQAKEIANIKKRVKRLERKKKLRSHGLKRLYKVRLSARVESSTEEENLGEEESSKPGRIEDIVVLNKDIFFRL
nr:reverse transcriptase domain-containing protein [Tanacetum cinerariifolium]